MIQMIMNYPEVYTDMVFVSIPICPLEFRSGTERCRKLSTVEDNACFEINSIIIREENN